MGLELKTHYKETIKEHLDTDFENGMNEKEYKYLKKILVFNKLNTLSEDSYRGIRIIYCYDKLIRHGESPSNQYEKDFLLCFTRSYKLYYKLRIRKLDLMIFELENDRLDNFVVYQSLSKETKEELNNFFEDMLEKESLKPTRLMSNFSINPIPPYFKKKAGLITRPNLGE